MATAPDRLDGQRTVVVTGGSRGLGAALVRRFLANGDLVATCSRASTDEVSDWAGDPRTAARFHFQALDLADRAACDQFVRGVIERFGRIDVLVNNAGLARDGVLPLFSAEDLDTVVDVNLKATIYLTKIVVRRMLPQRSGTVVNVSSVVGQSGYRGLSVYGATKAALDGFTRALARELGSLGINVNAVAPGYVRTEMTHGLDEEQLEQIIRRTPAGRLAETEDVVGAIEFLASPAASFITGHVLVVDGGLTA